MMIYLNQANLRPTLAALVNWAGTNAHFMGNAKLDLIAFRDGESVGSLLRNPGRKLEANQIRVQHNFLNDFTYLIPTDQSGSIRIKSLDSLWFIDVGNRSVGALANHLSAPRDLHSITYLKALNFDSQFELRHFPELRRLTIINSDGRNLDYLLALKDADNLKSLDIHQSAILEDCSAIEISKNLQRLFIGGSKTLTDVSPIGGLTELRELTLKDMSNLTDISALSDIKKLKRLMISGCDAILNLGGLNGSRTLEELHIEGCDGLRTLDGIQDMQSLQRLQISWCHRLKSVNAVRALPNLWQVKIELCSELSEFEKLKAMQPRIHLN